MFERKNAHGHILMLSVHSLSFYFPATILLYVFCFTLVLLLYFSRRGSADENKASPTKTASAAVVSAVAAATAPATAANLMPPPADPVNRASQSTTPNSVPPVRR